MLVFGQGLYKCTTIDIIILYNVFLQITEKLLSTAHMTILLMYIKYNNSLQLLIGQTMSSQSETFILYFTYVFTKRGIEH